jgi:hypothetical protein
MLRGEAANINIIVLGLTDAPRSTTREQTNHYMIVETYLSADFQSSKYYTNPSKYDVLVQSGHHFLTFETDQYLF